MRASRVQCSSILNNILFLLISGLVRNNGGYTGTKRKEIKLAILRVSRGWLGFL